VPDEPSIALRVREQKEPALVVRVNFGLFAGRHATPAEIDDLAGALRGLAPSFALVSEERHEFGPHGEASLHQVLIELTSEHAGAEPEALAERVVATAAEWANACIAARHGGGDL
jgi:hypothetical protein